MRYGSVPTTLLEWLALRLRAVPLPVLDILLGPIQARALSAAVRIGVFRALARGPQSLSSLAEACQADPETLELVLRVVRAMGYLRYQHERWSLSKRGERYFGVHALEPCSASAEYGEAQWRMMENLEGVLRSGVGIDLHSTHRPDEWKAYQRAMLEHAQTFAWFIADNMPVPAGAKLCLDIAGAHGLVGAELCRRHPPMRSTVLDRPEALETARELARSHGHADLLTFRAGDVLHDDFGTDVGVALLCNILHHFSAATNADILRRVHAALAPGGSVGIFDIEAPEPTAPPEAAGAALALYFRITSTSACRPSRDYERWLRAAGFGRVRTVRSVRMASRMLVVGEKVRERGSSLSPAR
ncbi:MAG TPA: class I SAM-dependent methyltransferase [Myxococcales bacterium]|jgi:SAM-dependent methyltransferase